MKAKCPYCSRKITYGVRFMERGYGEHVCKNCNKPSNIVQDKKIWALFAGCAAVSVLIALFYFCFSNAIQKDYNADGSYEVLVALFFGKFKTLKWALWELIPFIVFTFVSPIFVNYQMQKKYAYSTTDKIDLGTEFIDPVETAENDGFTRVIPKMGTTKVADDYDFEDISSSSGRDDFTRSFNLRENVTEINPESYVKSASAKSDAPLKKVERVQVRKIEEPDELYRVKVLREQERQKQEIQNQAKNMDKNADKNYSANRKF